MVDENSAIITIILGKDISDKEEVATRDYLHKHFSDLDIDIRRGDQPIYSFIVGVE